MKGKFIVLEGPDGSGKSTAAELLKNHLENQGVQVVLTREPGGTPISEKIRNLVLDNDNKEMGEMTEALLYAASRAQHVQEKIKPLLEQGYTVISDRFVISSLAYQGYARGLGIDKVKELNDLAIQDVIPDKVLFFEISPEEALKRKFIDREGDRMENEGNEFHKKTYEGYQVAVNSADNVIRINANGTKEEVLNECIQALKY